MKILVINAGSSSLKYQLIDMADESVLAKGVCERIGAGGEFTHKTASGYKYNAQIDMPDHKAAFELVKNALLTGEGKVINDLSEVSAIGHRIVQGGAKFKESVLVTPQVITDIANYAALAPLHNKAHVQGIEAAIAAFGDKVPQVVVFDTAFHSTMPPKAYMFGLPYEYYEKYAIRRYGFHGTSHRYVSKVCCELLGKPDGKGTRIITCHLGNGSSIAAIRDGKVVDTSMGLTPLDGFMMGTRSGAVDPSAVTFLMEKEHLTPHEMDEILNKKSGILGISGVSSDDRDIEAACKAGNERAQLAWEMRTYQIIKYIGGYIAALGGVDALVFTAGIGENQGIVRDEIMKAFAFMGVTRTPEALTAHGRDLNGPLEISGPDSSIRCFIIPTDEELMIARDTRDIVEAL